ncbi:hypothetical protein [Mesorhizobium sp. WSM4884]|uniref:hypothetical protein n=1 Tax=Mesorhizobium sp. WSM4884 TaxID=3038542 RepID=UPI002417A852|nr:hypothetical protein [Mesorhizobium sp. WSM4884]MDG4885448.1 hypothetical protein [Mesorhizobium sp. WSM4884]
MTRCNNDPQGKQMLRVVESVQEGGSPGGEITFSEVSFDPLGYAELRDAILHEPLHIPLCGQGKVIASNIEGLELGQIGRFNTKLESRFKSKSIGLVRGGWLPSAMALEDNSVVLPDRCVVAELNARLKNGLPKSKAENDFIDLFADSAIRINPLLFVLEGDARQNPRPEMVERHLSEAVSKLRSALPKAILVAADPQGLKGVLGLIQDTQPGMARKHDFLMRLNPKLKSPIGRRHADIQWDGVLATADACGVPRTSLVVIAALSTVAMQDGKSPAKRLLKFDGRYTEAETYNALADLRSLELLMYIFALFPDQHVMLCTADKNMALFWAGLRASNFAFEHGRLNFDVAPRDLLPGISEERWTHAMVPQFHPEPPKVRV